MAVIHDGATTDKARTHGHELDIVSRGLLMNQFIELARAATARMDYIEAANMWMVRRLPTASLPPCRRG